MRAEARSGLLLSTPYAAFLLLFSIFPIGFSIVLVLLKWDLVTPPSFAGLDNLQHLVGDARFWQSIVNTFVFLAIHLPLQIVVALTLALALNRRLVFRAFWRAAFFLPVVISGAAVTILWSALYATDVGLINGLLARLDLGPVPWLTDPAIAMPAIAVMATWKNVGFYIVIYLAGLQSVPRSCHEAVELEGATAWQSFPTLHRAVCLDRRRAAAADAIGHSLHVQERLLVPEDGLCGDARPGLGAAHRGRAHRPTPGHRKRGRGMRRTAFYLVLAVAAIAFLYPFLWMAATTFKSPAEVGGLSLLPAQPTLENYRLMWTRAPFGRALFNSLLVATTITMSVLVFGSAAAYALARLRFPGRQVLNAVTIAVLLVPAQLTLIPTYTLIVQFGWIDSYAALIVPYAFNATAILILRQFFLQVPRSLIDSARLDGMGELRILFTVFWPLAKAPLATVGILTFMGAWNEVLWPLLVVRDEQLMTLPQLLTVFSLGGGAGPRQLATKLAATMVLVVPVVAAYALLQRFFIESMASTGIKG